MCAQWAGGKLMKKLCLLSLQTATCWKCFCPAYVILALRVSFLPCMCLALHFLWSHSLQIFLLDILGTAILYSSIQTVCALLIPCLHPSAEIRCCFPCFPTSLHSAFMPLRGCMSVANATALLLCFHGPKAEHIISFFSSLTHSLADFSLSLSHTATLQVSYIHGFAGTDLPEPLPNAGISLGVDFLMPVEFLVSFLQYVVSQGVAVCWLKFLWLYFVYIFHDQGPRRAPDKILLFVDNNG